MLATVGRFGTRKSSSQARHRAAIVTGGSVAVRRFAAQRADRERARSSDQAPDEADLLGDPLFERSRPQRGGQRAPRVGLDLEEVAAVVWPQRRKALGDFFAGRLYATEASREDRHVEVDPPEALGRLVDRLRKILVEVDAAVAFKHRGLMKPPWLVEGPQRPEVVGGAVEGDRVRDLHPADPHAA